MGEVVGLSARWLHLASSIFLVGGATVLLAQTSADATTGLYTLTLPAAPPWVAPYVAAPASFVFAADATAGALYTVNASLNGVVKTAGPLTVTAGGTLTNNFAF